MALLDSRNRVALSLMTLGWLAGCSRGDTPDLAQVTGTVTRGGKPVGDLLVHFMPEGGRPSWGLTDNQGRFKLYYTQDNDGARLGRHRVFVQFNQAQPQSFAGTVTSEEVDLQATVDGQPPPPEKASAELSAEQRKAILARYGTLDSTPLQIEIVKDGQVVEIKLD